jgi:hypothetical protein
MNFSITTQHLINAVQAGSRALSRPLRGMGLSALAVSPMMFAFQIPNPFCALFNIVHQWLGGIIIMSIVAVVVAVLMRQFAPERFGHNVTNSILTIAVAIFILGLVLNGGQGLTQIAQALGLTGVDFTCPAI